jgi:hypothetical protein
MKMFCFVFLHILTASPVSWFRWYTVDPIIKTPSRLTPR